MIPAGKSSLPVLLFVGLVLLGMSGCSVSGLIIGVAHDANQPKEATVPSWQVQTLKPGAIIDITLKDGNTANSLPAAFICISCRRAHSSTCGR